MSCKQSIVFMMLIFLIGAASIAITPASPLTISINKSNYNLGETIIVTGTATANADVTIQLFNPLNTLVDMTYFKSGADGSYSRSFVIPSTIPMGSWLYGTYTVSAFSISETVNVTFTLQAVADTTPPVISTVTPAAGSTVITARPTITVSYSDNVAINTTSAKLTVDGVDVTASSTINATITQYTPTVDLSQGNHTLYFEVKDTAGNTVNKTWVFTLLIDTTAPVISGLRPANGTASSITSVNIGASYSDNVAINVSSVILNVDGVAVTPTTVTATAVSYSATLTEGMYTASLTVKDTSGNAATSSWTFAVDTTAPTISSLAPANGTIIESKSVTISASYSDNGAIDISSVILKVDGALVAPTVTATGVSYSATLEEGTHTVQLTVKDTAGNTATSTWTFSIKLPPNYTLYYILAAVVVVIIIVAALLLMRRK
jgi:hypothetical protein